MRTGTTRTVQSYVQGCSGRRSEERGIIACDFTLKIPGYSDKTKHLPMLIITKRRAMTRQVITRCFKSYYLNSHIYYGYTPLTAAAVYGEEKMLRLLCERADVLVNKQNGHGCTDLRCLSTSGNVKCIRVLLDVGKADADAPSGSRWTALHGAVGNVHLEAAALPREVPRSTRSFVELAPHLLGNVTLVSKIRSS